MLLYYSILAAALTASLVNGLQEKMVYAKRKISSTLGMYLRGHVFKTTTNAIDPQHCLADCWQENDRCQSFNFLYVLKKCELNEASNLTNPGDYIERPDSVYLTNTMFGRQKKPVMPRHTKSYPTVDPCASNPCQHAESCVQDLLLGYRCQQCHSQYRGPKCEEHMDPCSSNPCQNGGTCVSTMTRWRCVCAFPFQSITCTHVKRDYELVLNGSENYPYRRLMSYSYSAFTLLFWFKTAEQDTSYFMHHTPEDLSYTERLAVWRNGNTFFVELWKDYVYDFTFPLSYPVNNNQWRVATIVLHPNAELRFYLDGVMRESPKLTKAMPYAEDLYHFRIGTLRLGYFKDSNGDEHFFNGSIANVDMLSSEKSYADLNYYIVRRCIPNIIGHWANLHWVGLRHLSRPIDCSTRAPIMGIYNYYFRGTAYGLEQDVSPPKDLTAFTIVFQVQAGQPVHKPSQIACYANEGTDCHLSVVINENFTLGIVIDSTRFNVDLLPINDNQVHFFIITWTNVGGFFELIIDGMLQSSLSGIETNGKISGQSRFTVGNYFSSGYIHNLNVWDKVLSDEVLYTMAAQPGDEPGNVIAWKDFKKPNVTEQVSKISTKFHDMRVQPIGRNSIVTSFSEPFSSYILWLQAGCCRGRSAITLTMWLSVKKFGGKLFSIVMGDGSDPPVALRMLPDGNIIFFLKGQNASLGKIVRLGTWNFLAVSWSNTGNLYRNLNGVHESISSNFAAGEQYIMDIEGGTLFGDEESDSIWGAVSQVNYWLIAVPPSALMALSRGINGIGSNHISWNMYSPHAEGNANSETRPIDYYYPDFLTLKKKDQHCNNKLDLAHCVGKYRARIGWNNYYLNWGCFCEENLSKDMNFNHGLGDYTEHQNLVKIV